MTKSNFEGWNRIIKNTPMKGREPMWDQAIKYLVSECAMEPTVYDTLTQGQIQDIILDSHPVTISELLQEFGKWLARVSEERRFYIIKFRTASELWLAYLMRVYYATEWDGKEWVNIA